MPILQGWIYGILLVQLAKSCPLSNRFKDVPPLNYHVTSTRLLHFENISEIRKNFGNGQFIFQIECTANTIYDVAARLKNIEVMNWKTNIHIYRENTKDYLDIREQNFQLVDGFVFSERNSSSVNGYIIDTFFYGTIRFGNLNYYIENLRDHPEIYNKYRNFNYNAVIFKDNSLNLTITQTYDEAQNGLYNRHISFINANNEKEIFKLIIGNGKVCTLFILVDNFFLRNVHHNDIRSATIHVLSCVENANSLFRSTDFDEDGFPDNIGFLIKYFVILESEKSALNLLPKYDDAVDGALYLNMFSQYAIINEVCLGIAFTGHTFKSNVLGISYTAEATNKKFFKFSVGGICDRPHKYQPGENLNVLAVSPMLKSGNTVAQHIFDLTLTHELGHAFGSDHDVSDSCSGYLMMSSTPKDTQRKRFIFSSCSKRNMLATIISKGHCFENYEDPFCGNGIVEAGEDCDCGTARDCEDFDVCCVPQGQGNSCKVNKHVGYECHPSQGICCSLVCKYKDLSNFDLDCKHFDRMCPCEGKSETCSCGVDGNCTGNICSSKECVRILLRECECPLSEANGKCKTCCLYNNVCSSSSTLTKKLIEKHNSLITTLKQLETKENNGNKFGYYKNFSANNESVELYFREVEVNDYCLLFGKVGICRADYECFTPTRQIYPSLRRGSSIRNNVSELLLIFNFICSYSIWLYFKFIQ